MTRYLLKSPTGQFFKHPTDSRPSGTCGVYPDDRGNSWTADPATAHAWVDWDRAIAAARCWHLLHGEQLTVVTANSLPTLRVGLHGETLAVVQQ